MGGALAIAILFYLLFNPQGFSELDSLLWIHFTTLLIHQYEEYVFPGGFKDFFNKNIYNKNPVIRSPLTDQGVLFVNIGLGWSAYLYAAFHGMNAIWLAIGLCLVTIFNGFLHTFLLVFKRKYNPGVVSSILLMIPFGIYLMKELLKLVDNDKVISGIVIFIVAILLIPLAIFLTSKLNSR